MISMLLVAALQMGASPDTLPLRLDQATQRALLVSPVIAAAQGAVRGPRGLRSEAWWPFPDNPSLEYGRIRREVTGSRSYDRDWSVTQEIEIAGQWAVRGSAANALVRSAEARVVDAARLVGLETRRAYSALSTAERRAALTDSAAALSERLAQFARRQFEAGETNRLEMNAAVLDAARARSAAERAAGGLAEATANLARLLGLPSDTIPRTTALPEVPNLRWSSDSTLVALATSRRPDMSASIATRQSAERRSTAARLGIVPNLTLAAVGGREAGTDQLLGFTVGVRIPLFHWQQGARGQAAAERAEAQADEVGIERLVRAEVVAASARFRRARAAEQRFEAQVLQAAAENVALTERAVVEGELSLTDMLVLRNTALAAQLEYLDVRKDAADAWFTLAAALAAEPGELTALVGTGG